MLVQIVTENGQKKVIPLTADAGAGNPVGSYLYLEKKSNPQGYLYCDGSTFDETKYPLLYDYLGSNVLPDWRELGAKGAEKNTTLIFDSTETDPSTGQAGTQNHDVFAQGEFKDDQLQEHSHTFKANVAGLATSGAFAEISTGGSLRSVNTNTGRSGTVTRGKSRAVFIYIKATSGLSENAQDNVVAQLNEERSYSTEETNTGKKWIDGKPIYRKVIDIGALPNATSKSVAHNISNLEQVVTLQGVATNPTSQASIPLPYVYPPNINYSVGLFIVGANINIEARADVSGYNAYAIIEYTKTTD